MSLKQGAPGKCYGGSEKWAGPSRPWECFTKEGTYEPGLEETENLPPEWCGDGSEI